MLKRGIIRNKLTQAAITQHGKGWLNKAHGGGFYMNDNDWIRSVNNKGIYTGGQLKGGTIRANGRLSVGEFLHLDEKNAVQPGWGCSPNGLVMARKRQLSFSPVCAVSMWGGGYHQIGPTDPLINAKLWTEFFQLIEVANKVDI